MHNYSVVSVCPTFVVFERFEHGVFGGVGTDGVPQPVAGDHDEVLQSELSIQSFDGDVSILSM